MRSLLGQTKESNSMLLQTTQLAYCQYKKSNLHRIRPSRPENCITNHVESEDHPQCSSAAQTAHLIALHFNEGSIVDQFFSAIPHPYLHNGNRMKKEKQAARPINVNFLI